MPMSTGLQPIVCVIDESRTVRNFICSALGELDICLLDYASAASAASQICDSTARPPALVITESAFRDIDGRSFIRRLRSEERLSALSILVFSRFHDAETVEAFLRTGADDYLAKPAAAEELLARASVLVSNAAQRGRDDLPEREIVIATDNIGERDMLRAAMNAMGHPVVCTSHPRSIARLCRQQTGLVLFDIDLPGLRMEDLISEVRDQAPTAKLMVLCQEGQPMIEEARRRAGIVEWIPMPVSTEDLPAKLECVRQPRPRLADLEFEPTLLKRLLGGTRPQPPLIPLPLRLRPKPVQDLLKAHPDLMGDKLLRASEGIELDDRQLATPGQSFTQGLLAELGSSVPDQDIPIKWTWDLGSRLYTKMEPTAGDVLAALKVSPVGFVLQSVPPDAAKAAFSALHDALGYLDAFAIWVEGRLGAHSAELSHALAVGFLAALSGRAAAVEAKLSAERTDALLGVLSLSGLLTATARRLPDAPVADAYNRIERLPRDTRQAADLFTGIRLFGAVGASVKHLHDNLHIWHSRWDAFVEVVQLADMLVGLTSSHGVVAPAGKPQPSPESYSLQEAGLILADWARRDLICFQPTDRFLRTLGIGHASAAL